MFRYLLFIAFQFHKGTIKTYNLYKRLGMFVYGNAMNTFANKFGELQEIKRKFDKKKTRDINWFKTKINNQVMQ